MDKKRAALVIIGVILIIILLAVKSTEPAIATNSNGNKTFSNGGISFEYPQNWQESTDILNMIFAGDFMGILSGTTLGDLSSPTGSYDLTIQKYSLSDFNANSTQDFLDKNRKEMEDSNSTIISENTTNVNGLTIYEMLTYSSTPGQYTPGNILCNSCKGSESVHFTVQSNINTRKCRNRQWYRFKSKFKVFSMIQFQDFRK